MKVNEGSLRFNISGDIEDIYTQIVSSNRQHTDQNMIQKQVMRVMLKSSKDRYITGAVSSSKPIEDDIDLVNKRISNIEADWIIKKIMNDISGYQVVATKKDIIIWLIISSQYYQFKSSFRLLEDLSGIRNNYDSTLISKMEKDNKEINKLIESWDEKVSTTIANARKEFYSKIEPYLNNISLDDFINTYGEKILTEQTSNTKKNFRKYEIIKLEHWDDFVKEMNKLRKVNFDLITPTQEDVCNHFGVNKDYYSRNYPGDLNLLMNTLGFELSREVVR